MLESAALEGGALAEKIGARFMRERLAYVLEENGFPSAPAILGVVLGGMLEENFISSMIKAAP